MTGIVIVHKDAEAAVYHLPRPARSVGHHSNKFPFSFPNVDTVFSRHRPFEAAVQDS